MQSCGAASAMGTGRVDGLDGQGLVAIERIPLRRLSLLSLLLSSISSKLLRVQVDRWCIEHSGTSSHGSRRAESSTSNSAAIQYRIQLHQNIDRAWKLQHHHRNCNIVIEELSGHWASRGISTHAIFSAGCPSDSHSRVHRISLVRVRCHNYIGLRRSFEYAAITI